MHTYKWHSNFDFSQNKKSFAETARKAAGKIPAPLSATTFQRFLFPPVRKHDGTTMVLLLFTVFRCREQAKPSQRFN